MLVEVMYNNDPLIPHQYRWVILRTRWDKTENVYKYQKRYGNFKDIAIKTWNFLNHPDFDFYFSGLACPTSDFIWTSSGRVSFV